MAEEQPEIKKGRVPAEKTPTSNILSHNYCNNTFKNVLRGKTEDVNIKAYFQIN